MSRWVNLFSGKCSLGAHVILQTPMGEVHGIIEGLNTTCKGIIIRDVREDIGYYIVCDPTRYEIVYDPSRRAREEEIYPPMIGDEGYGKRAREA